MSKFRKKSAISAAEGALLDTIGTCSSAKLVILSAGNFASILATASAPKKLLIDGQLKLDIISVC